jgi:hypothetical protein
MIFKFTSKPLHKDPEQRQVRQVQDMPDSHVEILRMTISDMIAETDESMRDELTEEKFEVELNNAVELEKAMYGLFKERGHCYGTTLVALLWIVADLQFEMADIVDDKKAADEVAEKIKEKEA